MSKYLCSTTENWRADSENEAQQLIDAAKASGQYQLSKSSTTLKEIKKAGEVLDSYYMVTLTKVFTNPKEPLEQFDVTYSDSAF